MPRTRFLHDPGPSRLSGVACALKFKGPYQALPNVATPNLLGGLGFVCGNQVPSFAREDVGSASFHSGPVAWVGRSPILGHDCQFKGLRFFKLRCSASPISSGQFI